MESNIILSFIPFSCFSNIFNQFLQHLWLYAQFPILASTAVIILSNSAQVFEFCSAIDFNWQRIPSRFFSMSILSVKINPNITQTLLDVCFECIQLLLNNCSTFTSFLFSVSIIKSSGTITQISFLQESHVHLIYSFSSQPHFFLFFGINSRSFNI